MSFCADAAVMLRCQRRHNHCKYRHFNPILKLNWLFFRVFLGGASSRGNGLPQIAIEGRGFAVGWSGAVGVCLMALNVAVASFGVCNIEL